MHLYRPTGPTKTSPTGQHFPNKAPNNQNITKRSTTPTASITNCYFSFGNSLSDISHLETDITKQGNEERQSVEAKDLEELVMDSEEENLDMVGAYGEEVNFLPKLPLLRWMMN